MSINIYDLGTFDDFEDLNKSLEQRINQINRAGVSGFDGLSPEQMSALQTFFPLDHPNSPLIKNDLDAISLNHCPLLMQIQFLMGKMRDGKEIKLTKTGALPTSLVKEIYAQGYLKNEWIERGFAKVYRESEIEEIHISRLLLEISSLAKKRNNKMSLTQRGQKHIDDGNLILSELLQILLYKFNWGYFDAYKSEDIGQIIPGFSIYLIKKYGDKERPTTFYAQKYFEAFPQLGGTHRDFNCYETRVFSRYFNFLGLVKVPEQKIYGKEMMVKKTPFCDELFSFQK